MAKHFPGLEPAILALYEHSLLDDAVGEPCDCFEASDAGDAE